MQQLYLPELLCGHMLKPLSKNGYLLGKAPFPTD